MNEFGTERPAAADTITLERSPSWTPTPVS